MRGGLVCTAAGADTPPAFFFLDRFFFFFFFAAPGYCQKRTIVRHGYRTLSRSHSILLICRLVVLGSIDSIDNRLLIAILNIAILD